MDLFELLKPLIEFFTKPFQELIKYLGLEENVIKIGFGQIEWLNFNLYDLTSLIVGSLVVIFIMIIFYKFIRFFFRLFGGSYLWKIYFIH